MNESPPTHPSAPTIEAETASRTTFAAAQNAVPLLRRLTIHNHGDQTLSNLRLTMRPQPAFCESKQWAIDAIAPGQSFQIAGTDVTLDFKTLDRLNEAERGQLTFTLEQGKETLTEEIVPIELLARNQWGGLGEMGQLLAAFVAPNHPAVEAILKDASRILTKGNHRDAMDGYQSGDPRRARLLANAIWNATVKLGLSYAEPPKSFEEQGQKIRDPGRITDGGLATCLDSSLLLAAAFEAAGLHPAVLLTEEHAFVGVWVVPKTFGRTLEPDAMEVRKAVDAREFIVLESTLVTQKPGVDFKRAFSVAQPLLEEGAQQSFRMAIDLARARDAGIKPLSSAKPSGGDNSLEPYQIAAPGLLDEDALGDLPSEPATVVHETKTTRLQRWQTKLLDLTLRNRLLNFRPTRQTLKLVCHDVAALEDALAGGDKFKIVSLRSEDPIGNRDSDAHLRSTGNDIEQEYARSAFAKGEICAAESESEMQTRLTTLYRKAKSDLAEGGANTLFLAVGFLRWRQEPSADRVYKAPLLLLPISLNRRSVKSPYYISHHSDDIVFNQTLLEFLETEFDIRIPALRGPLPEDDSGLDISQILDLARQGVRDAPGFEVVEECDISTFSFAKYLMWKDLRDRTESLKNNRLVAHLLDHPDKTYDDGHGDFPEPEQLDEKSNLGRVFTPLPADSSQLAAVLAAEAGKDFVIIGPPGTGKSQTIANMIAHCLAHGKTVLFVAEKAAALDVVHRRLKAYGLADACLELHSNKADRRNVLAQLGAAWDRSEASNRQRWLQSAKHLREHRDSLNGYVEALHAPGSHGRSIYEAIGIVTEGPAPYRIAFENADAHDATSFNDLVDLVDRLALVQAAVQDCESLHLIDTTEWSFSWQDSLLGSARALKSSSEILLAASHAFADELSLPLEETGPADQIEALTELAAVLLETSGRDLRFLTESKIGELKEAFGPFETATKIHADNRSQLSAAYQPIKIPDIPTNELDLAWRRASTKFWPFSWLGRRSVRRLLQTYTDGTVPNPGNDLDKLAAMQSAGQDIFDSPISALPGFKGVDSDPTELRSELQHGITVTNVIRRVERAFDLDDAFIERLSDMLGPQEPSAQHWRKSTALRDAFATFSESRSAFEKHAGRGLAAPALRQLQVDLDGLHDKSDRLNDWVKWSSARHEAERRGLQAVVEAVESGITPEPRQDFLRAYFSWWLRLAIDRSDHLRTFTHWEHEDRIKKFRELVETVQTMAATQVRAAIAGDLPHRDEVPKQSELGLLRHQLGLKRPSKSIRDLIAGMPETLTTLTPCVLMSPLSVAQFLTAEREGFDIVIFDEASQITTWDAIGAIARGRQSIIVGDPKQLPPTNFFGRSNEEEEDELDYHEKDLPSILDEASDAGLSLHQLNWHYRSRDEDLIAFSNHHYYGQRLVTFPSPSTDSQAVQIHAVEGVYARGKGRTNEVEARAVVDFILRRLEEWSNWPEEERLSIGVITFNAPQQELILDLLDEARTHRSRAHLEWFFSEEREEPVMVKNLENVQGDERDVMVFSITFGPDAAGRIAMDFGAVNREGGEKRLNVAVTRAKSEFHVFSSITADDIDLRRTSSIGVRHLKNYLDYAARGEVALPGMDEGSLGPPESPFEESVAKALQAQGWDVRTQIGVSGFRIDLGIVHPDRPGSYLAGIECDGATYHRSATARDRDQIREGVLRNLGWEIHRIWSTDWFMNPAEAIKRADERLQELLETSRSKAADSQANTETGHAAAPLPPATSDTDDGFEDEFEGEADLPAKSDRPESDVSEQANFATPANQDRFFESSYTSTLQFMVDEIVDEYAPLAENTLFRTVAKRHEWERAGRRIQDRIKSLLGGFELREEDGTVFIWKPGTHEARLPYRSQLKRSTQHIPREEILGLIQANPLVLRSADPPKAVADLMGLGRLTASTRSRLETCLEDHRQTNPN